MRTPDRRIKLVREIVKDLREWRKDPSNLTIYQFLASRNIGNNVLRQLRYEFPELDNEWEITLSQLAVRWFEAGMSTDKLPAHKEKLMMRHLKFYDRFSFQEELEAKQEAELAKVMAAAQIAVDNYADAELEEPYATLYKQASKRGETS